jgi:hypothetical protein
MCYQENQIGYLQMFAARGNNFAEKLQEHQNVCVCLAHVCRKLHE